MLLGWSPSIEGVGSLLNLDAILGKVEVATTCSMPPCCPSIGKGVGRGFPMYGPVTLASEYFVAQHY